MLHFPPRNLSSNEAFPHLPTRRKSPASIKIKPIIPIYYSDIKDFWHSLIRRQPCPQSGTRGEDQTHNHIFTNNINILKNKIRDRAFLHTIRSGPFWRMAPLIPLCSPGKYIFIIYCYYKFFMKIYELRKIFFTIFQKMLDIRGRYGYFYITRYICWWPALEFPSLLRFQGA